MEAVANADDTGNPCQSCFLNDAQLFNRIIIGKPDVGMFASFDPVALDMACADAVNRQPVIAGSILDEREHCHHDHFTDVHPETNWMVALEHAEKLGLGSREYELIEI